MDQDIQSRFEALEKQLAGVKKTGQENKASIVVFSGDLDKAMAALIIATGSAAMGMEVHLFFTFWGTPLLRAKNATPGPKDFLSKMFGWMLPKGADQATLSKLHMGGAGTAMLKGVMKKKNVNSVSALLELAGELDIKITICELSMDIMGFTREEMVEYPNLQYGGVAAFVADASKSKMQLFI